MFDAILRFSVKKKLFVGLTTLFLLIGGIYSMLTLPIDAVPDITNINVIISMLLRVKELLHGMIRIWE